MMSQSLYRLGRLGCPPPVGRDRLLAGPRRRRRGRVRAPSVTSSRTPSQVPGLDSQQASELLAAAGAGRCRPDGPGRRDPAGRRRDVLRLGGRPGPRSPSSRPAPRAAPRARHQRPGGALAGGTEAAGSGVVSPDGRVALIRLQYPVGGRALRRRTSATSRPSVPRREAGSPLRIEMGGDLFFAFEQAAARPGRAHRAARRGAHPASRLRVADRHGPPDRHGGVRARRRRQLDVAARQPDRHPQLGAGARQHGRARRRHRLRPVRRDPAP